VLVFQAAQATPAEQLFTRHGTSVHCPKQVSQTDLDDLNDRFLRLSQRYDPHVAPQQRRSPLLPFKGTNRRDV
jgi:hypothetical protein